MISALKKFLRKNKPAVWVYYRLKKVAVYLLRFTSLKTLLEDSHPSIHLRKPTTFPLRALFSPAKLSILKTVAPYTLLGYSALENAYDLAEDVEKKGLSGSFVECGTWKGGAAATMAAVAHRYGNQRKTWYFDSFEGMPEPTQEDKKGEGKRGGTEDLTGDMLKASISDVEEVIFEKLKLPRENNIIVKGWFQDTLPEKKREIGPIAILRLDGDWYESTKVCLEELYDQVVSGGYVIVDDYGAWAGCKKAVHEFFDKRGINPKLHFIGTHDPEVFSVTPPAYFQKP
ncbi:MAG: TylF/MycF/NovP-related O-methyltransferase [bacterium]|nr:TylF/MycF/NovP-related O-methyltransferase [bacterium]